MPWTDATHAKEWVQGVDLIVDPSALAQSITDAMRYLRGRLCSFIAQATVDSWTTTADTPDIVQLWTARLTAAMFLAKALGYQLQPEIVDTPASRLFADVHAEIDQAMHGQFDIIDAGGNKVAVEGMPVSAATNYVKYLPVEMGGEY